MHTKMYPVIYSYTVLPHNVEDVGNPSEGAVIGGSVGGSVAVIVLVVIIVMCVLKRR